MNYHHLTDQQKARREKLNKLKALKGQLDPYQIETVTFNTTISQINAQYASSSLEEISQLNQRWILGGRISHLRLPFGVLSYQHAELQVYFANNHPAFSSLLQLIDLGDFVQVSGQLFFTKTNHLTLKADSLTIIAKALLPLPDQHYGFKDVEQRLRKRYLDTITHQSV